MMLQIKRWLAPPVFPDDEHKTRRAILLNSALLTSMVLALFLIAGNLAGGTVPAVVTGLDIGLVAMCLLLRRWAYQGRVGLASGALLAVGLVGITMAVAMLGTIRAPSTAVYMLLVIFAGLMFDLGGMIAMTVLCSLAIAGLIVAENTGLLPRPDYAVTITQWVAYSVLFAWVGSLTLSSIQSTRRALARAEKEITERKQAEEAFHLLSDTQRQIAQKENLADIFRLVGQKIHELIGDGYVGVTILDEQEQAMKVIGLYGLGSLPESLVRMLEVNPSKMVFDLKDMTADELRLFRSGNLEKFEKGLYHLSVRKVPERVCEVAEKALKLTGVYTMGFVLHDLHFGGLTILAKRDITPHKAMIETITNQATIAMHRIKAETSLRTSEEQLRLITDNMMDMVIRSDLQGRILYASPSHKTILGYEPEHPVGRSIYDLMHPEDIDRVREFALASLQDRTTGKQEFRYLHADGHYLWLESTGALIFDDDGSPAGAVFSTRDITERKQAEETLHQSEERFRALIENATDLILVLNPDGTGRYISPSVERILGFHPDELVGMSSADIIHPDDLAAALGAIAYRVQNPRPGRSVFRISCPAQGWFLSHDGGDRQQPTG